WTCALTTHRSPPSATAACSASAAVVATRPCGTGIAYSAKSAFAWYSWRFIRKRSRSVREAPYCPESVDGRKGETAEFAAPPPPVGAAVVGGGCRRSGCPAAILPPRRQKNRGWTAAPTRDGVRAARRVA